MRDAHRPVHNSDGTYGAGERALRKAHLYAPARPPLAAPPAAALPEPLSPHVLTLEAMVAIDDHLEQGRSPRTRQAQQARLAYWHAWFSLRFRQALTYPVPVAAVQQFVIDHLAREGPGGQLVHELPAAIDTLLVEQGHKARLGPLAIATVTNRLSALSQAHEQRGLPNPCRDPAVRRLLSSSRRGHGRRGASSHQVDPLESHAMAALLATCGGGRLIDKRDRALLMFAWNTGGRRRAEVARADMRWLQRVGPGHYEYELRHSKTNPEGERKPDNFKPIVDEAAQALGAWLAASGITQGRIFRSVNKAGQLGQSLREASVRDIVLRRCKLAGLIGHYSAHSLRSGFSTSASKKGVQTTDIMAVTGHGTHQGLNIYVRPTGAIEAVRRAWGGPPP